MHVRRDLRYVYHELSLAITSMNRYVFLLFIDKQLPVAVELGLCKNILIFNPLHVVLCVKLSCPISIGNLGVISVGCLAQE